MPLEIVWSPLARARLEEIRAFAALDKPDAVARLATRIGAVIEALKTHPYLGRAGAEPGVRQLVIGGTPYVVLYRVRGRRVTISAIWHAAQRNDVGPGLAPASGKADASVGPTTRWAMIAQ